MTSIIFTEAYLNREWAEDARENFLERYLDDLLDQNLFLVEDDIKYINYQYVVRILLANKQMELPLE